MDSLQFQKLELADSRPKCVACKSTIEHSYFHLAGQTICPTCAEITRSAQARPGNLGVMRGFLYGLGAAAACSVGYAVITLATHMQLALISILVGYLIGRAVRIGSRGLGGLRCQILAVVLTYLAITTSYVPLVIQAMADQSKKEQAKKADPVKSDSGKSALRPSAGAFALGVVVITGIAIVSPFLALAGGTGGILGAIILAVGLMQAWKQTRRDERLLMGPYTLEERPALG